MKLHDRYLFGIPLLILILVVSFVALFYWQLENFEKSYLREAENNVAKRADLAALILLPLLDDGQIVAAKEFCDGFRQDGLRLTLIDANGTVIADSSENVNMMGNHLNRQEIESALNSSPKSVIRYSDSLQMRMVYHALLLDSAGGKFVLRAALSIDRTERMLFLAKSSMTIALVCGVGVALLLTFYIFGKVRRPLLELHGSVSRISAGELDTVITIPERGAIRDLAQDISEMTEELKRQLAKSTFESNANQALLNAMTDAVLLVDEEGKAVRFNRAAMQLFNLDRQGLRFSVMRAGIDGLPAAVNTTFRDEQPFEREFNFASSALLIKGVLLRENERKLLLMTITDLSNLRQLESFRSDFIANVSHEIKTPLTGIIGAVEILQETKKPDREIREKLLSLLAKQANRLNRLVQDILSLAALEKKEYDPKQDFAAFDLDSAVANAVNSCLKKAEKNKVKLTLKHNDAVKIYGDWHLIEQAVINLINNAIKYSSSPEVEVSLEAGDNQAVIAVRDNGVGIAPEHQRRIFERFYRVHKERSRELGGTGLGLAIVKHTAQLHGGTASVDSVPGEYTVFTITLPCRVKDSC